MNPNNEKLSENEMGAPCGKCGIPVYKPQDLKIKAKGYIECCCVIVSGVRWDFFAT